MEGDLGSVIAECARLAASGEGGALAVVVRVRGSGPQVAGAKLVLRADGRFTGTVGGGAVEAAVLRDAASLIESNACAPALGAEPPGSAVLRGYKLAAELGMCCGGTMELLLAPISHDERAAAAWSLAARATREEGGAMALVVASEDPTVAVGTLVVATPRDGVLASFDLGAGAPGRGSPADPALARACAAAREADPPAVHTLRSERGASFDAYLEPLAPTPRFVLFGGGHVAKPLAALARMLGYDVTVVDDRSEWASAERFPGATLVHEPYEDFLHRFAPRASDTLVIVTRGHDFDQDVLAALVDKPSRYLGMIGSRAKVKRAFLRLEAANVTPALVARVHAPVGLALGAQTPEEIAVAVAAELVLERRGRPRPASVPAWWRE